MVRSLLLLCSLVPALAHGATARRAVMENLATTGNSLFVSSAATRVGVGTSTPAVTLDVVGQAQFGSAASKSTFTTVGALVMASGSSITLSGANGFITGASSITASAFFGNGSGITGLSAGVLTATQTFSGTNSFTVSAPSSGSFSLNALYAKSLLSGFAVYSTSGSGSAFNTLNVSSITFRATGKTRINWAKPMASAYYVCSCTVGNDNVGASAVGFCGVDFIAADGSSGMTPTTLDLVASNTSGTDTNITFMYVMCFGGAETTGLK